ncbi:MAG: 23S rRNA (adenine(2503)-C(2))-methyltransferase RlmN [Verrucomicrobiota bacterium]
MRKKFFLDAVMMEWEIPEGAEYRRKQIAEWVFKKRVDAFEKMSNLPVEWRKELASRYELRAIEFAKVQGKQTQKFLWKLSGGDFIESVLIPASPALYGEKSDRVTLCLSTQVGCAYGCKFCASGLKGWKRNLLPAEIISQIIEAERHSGKKINNLVFMGMGEPLANYENLMKAIEIINAPWGIGLGARHITISTCGLAPQIKKLADQPLQLRLAISLHAASDSIRNRIMPVNKKYPLTELLNACRYYVSKKQKMITLEYILIEDINDMPSEAVLLAQHANKLRAKINLIPYNPVEGLPWKRPASSVIQNFAHTLKKHDALVTLRTEKGSDIDAACGQLRLKEISLK